MELGDGESALRAPLERLPSSAESDSAFSTATEAESEMTDRDYEDGQSITPRQTYFLCYATDCLSAYESIKKRSLSGVRALDDVSSTADAVRALFVRRERLLVMDLVRSYLLQQQGTCCIPRFRDDDQRRPGPARHEEASPCRTQGRCITQKLMYRRMTKPSMQDRRTFQEASAADRSRCLLSANASSF